MTIENRKIQSHEQNSHFLNIGGHYRLHLGSFVHLHQAGTGGNSTNDIGPRKIRDRYANTDRDYLTRTNLKRSDETRVN